MKMFLTRMGFGSRVIITGDLTQVDLPHEKVSGLKEAVRVLKGIDDIAVCELTARDVVRHVLVQRIVKAYEDYEGKEERGRRAGKGRREGRGK
jgi:phosphate starvation-inducible PhoH-like protein